MTLFPDKNRLTFNTVDIFAIDLTPNDIKSCQYKLKTRSYYLKTRQYDPKSPKNHPKSPKIPTNPQKSPQIRKNHPKSQKIPTNPQKSPQTTAKNTYLHLSALDITLSSGYQDKRCRINQILSDISPNPSTERPQRGVVRDRSWKSYYMCLYRVQL